MPLDWTDPPLDPAPERIGARRSLAGFDQAPESPLRPITMTTVDGVLQSWLETRFTPGVTLMTGGWEDWVQFDLAGWLHQSLGGTVAHRWDVERRVRIFRDPDAQVGLLLNGRTATPACPLAAVGIVAESPLGSRPDFLNRVHAEVARLHRAHLRPPYDSAERHVLALTQDLGSVSVLQKHGFEVRADTGTVVVAWRLVEG